jgi:membrane protease YdiL (CAAX protease family)
VPLLSIAVFHLSPAFLGLTLGSNWPSQLLWGLIIGVAMAGFGIAFRTIVLGFRFRRPTLPDHILQGSFYLLINGPVEEFFFRGFILTIVTQLTGWLWLGWLVSTTIYTLYHRLGHWSWRSILGVGLAGILFSTLYVFQPSPRSLLMVTIIHGFTTWGFLSLSDEVLYQLSRRKK